MKTTKCITVILIVAFLLMSGNTPMQTHASMSEPQLTPAPYATLFANANKQQLIRVIVGLNMDAESENGAALSDTDQETRIAAVQQHVLDKLTADSHLAAASLMVHHQYTTVPALALTVDPPMLQVLAEAPEVAYIIEDALSAPTLDQSAPAIGANVAWEAGYTGAGWSVAILDSGVDSDHPFLQNKVVAEACFSSVIDGYSTSFCPNGEKVEIGKGSGENCDTSIAACMHGTHVAGIAAGKNATMAGIARDASVIAIQIFSRFDNDEYCGGQSPCILSFASDQIAALEHIYQLRTTHKIAAVNLSLGRGQYTSPAVCDAENLAYTEVVKNLTAANIAVVSSAGNAGYTNGISYPACMSDVVSVGATDTRNMVASFSNSSSILDLLAPGVAIQSSIPGGNFSDLQGTSMASPHVVGAWAVIRSQTPDVTRARVLSVLKQTGLSIIDSRNNIKVPLVQLDRALRAFDGIELDMTMDVSPKNANPGDQLTYTMHVTNTGIERVSQVVLTSTIPLGTELLTVSDNGQVQNGVIRWDSMTIGASQSLVRTYQVKVAPAYPVSASFFYDDMENGKDKWRVWSSEGNTKHIWNQHIGLPHSGTTSWYAKNVGETSQQFLVMLIEEKLPANAELKFWHWYNTEIFFDGGIVEISTDNGASWQDLGVNITQNGYDAKMDDYYGNPLGKVRAFTGSSKGYKETRVNLSSYAGKSVLIRFQFATDSSGEGNGWYIDDVSIATTSHMQSNARVMVKAFIERAAVETRVEPKQIAPPPPTTNEPGQAIVDKGQGATITVTDEQGRNTTVEIPDEAVDELTRIVYTAIDEEPSHTLPETYLFAGRAFQIAAYHGDEQLVDFTFQQPILITVTYDTNSMTASEEATLMVYARYGGSDTWQQLASTDYSLDTTEHKVQIPTTMTGEFMLMYEQELQAEEHIMLFPLIMFTR